MLICTSSYAARPCPPTLTGTPEQINTCSEGDTDSPVGGLFVDAANGANDNDGDSPESALQTLHNIGRLARGVVTAGEGVWLSAGQVWDDQVLNISSPGNTELSVFYGCYTITNGEAVECQP